MARTRRSKPAGQLMKPEKKKVKPESGRERRERKRAARLAARNKLQQRRRLLTARGVVFLLLLGLACSIGMLVLTLLGRPYPWESLRDVVTAQRVTNELDRQQDRWTSLTVEHYQITVEYESGDGTRCGPATIEVEDRKILEMPTPADTHWFPADSCRQLIPSLIPDNAFGWLEEQMEAFQPGETAIQMVFDRDFGYPLMASIQAYDMERAGEDCCWTVIWSGFAPVYEMDGE
nr:hypothetical protein [Anaerolineae bacterium]